MFKKILLTTSATAASDHSDRVAFNIAKKWKSHLAILNVIGAPARGFSNFIKPTLPY